LRSAGKDPLDAFIKAVGTLAQVIHIITPRRTKRGNSKLHDGYVKNLSGRPRCRARSKLANDVVKSTRLTTLLPQMIADEDNKNAVMF
jgi:hypothetical protein